ncbi:PQQ-binding-like beta-propeller repeat protein [Actinoplanes sp. NPDC049681]|uniref:outer membrane protein assembly factor BamB family protein n=1 Tax=Actinoplanes sp. NPDC049681 TaxID=3363905 RepID=UPI00379D8D15
MPKDTMKILHIAIRVIATASLLIASPLVKPSSATAATSASWAQPGYDAAGTYYNPAERVINAASVGKLKLKWKFPRIYSNRCLSETHGPLVIDNRVLAVDDWLTAYAPATGKRLWRAPVDLRNQEVRGFTSVGKLAVVATRTCGRPANPDAAIYAFDATNGALRWQLRDDVTPDLMLAADGMILFAGVSVEGAPQAMYGVEASSGRKRWTQLGTAERQLWPSDVVAGSRVTVRHSNDGADRSDVIDIRTGTTLWTAPRNWDAIAASASGDKVFMHDYDLYEGTLQELVHAVDARTGVVKWTARHNGAQAATDGRHLYISGWDSVISCFDTATGKQLWTRDTGLTTWQPVRAGGLVWVPRWYTGRMPLALNASTGAKLTVSSALGNTQHIRAIVGGHLYAEMGSSIGVFAP